MDIVFKITDYKPSICYAFNTTTYTEKLTAIQLKPSALSPSRKVETEVS
jgi:hypothetical protein